MRAQVDYYQEGGPGGCASEPDAQHPMTFGHGTLRPFDLSTYAPRQPELGEQLTVCIAGLEGASVVVLTMRAPDGTAVRHSRQPVTEQMTWYSDLPDRAPLGRYVVDARAGSAHVRGSFTVHPPAQPEYHVVPRGVRARIVDVVLLGLRSHERAELLFYRPLPYRPGTPLRAAYVTSASVRVAADGVGRFPIEVGPLGTVGAHCSGFVVKVRVRGRVLDDLHNTISLVTVCRK